MSIMPPGGGAPGGPPPGGPPPAGPPGQGPMPPMGGPPPMPAGAPVGGPTPASPTPFTDLSDKLPHHYQLLDVAASTIEQAINSGGFYKEPKVLAGVRSIHGQLAAMISNGAGRGGSAGPMGGPPTGSTGSADLSSDADAGDQPEGDDFSEEPGADES